MEDLQKLKEFGDEILRKAALKTVKALFEENARLQKENAELKKRLAVYAPMNAHKCPDQEDRE